MTSTSSRLRLLVSALVILACGCALLAGGGRGMAASATTSITVQAMDSCKSALDGAGYSVSGGSLGSPITVSSTGTGKGTVVATASCPLARGNCSTFHIGCVTIDGLPVPGTYRMHVTTTPPANVSNPEGYAACQGGSACQREEATITISAGGGISATVTNIYPDGTSVTSPAGGTFAGSATDPIVFHLFGLAPPNANPALQCDGDADADDHLTGSPSSHCAYPEAAESAACTPYPWSCAFADAGTTTTTTSSGSTSTGSSSTTTSSSSTSSTTTGTSTSTTSTTTSTAGPGGTTSTTSTSSSTSSATPGSGGTCSSQATVTWPQRVTGHDSRTRHIRTVLAGALSATLSGAGTTGMQLSIQDASGHVMVSRSAGGGNLTVSLATLPANSSVYVVYSITFADQSAKSSYSLAVTHC